MNAARAWALLLLSVAAVSPSKYSIAANTNETPEEIVVTGRLPGPPLWKVSNGENVLWIFPYLDWIPRDMQWDSQRVARIIAQSDEALGLPVMSVHHPASLVMNPFNIVRGTRLVNRLDRYPDGGTLEQNLPPELYARYAAVQARYFPRERGYAFMRPREVSGRMLHIVREREGLVEGGEILDTISRLLRRNRDIVRTAIAIDIEGKTNYRDFANSLEELTASFPPEMENQCLEERLRFVEEDLAEAKRLANRWAEGSIAGFRDVDFYNVSVLNELRACDELYTGSSSPLQENMARATARLNQAWLDAAEKALETNTSTFAVLRINELLADDGLLGKLRTKGYDITEP